MEGDERREKRPAKRGKLGKETPEPLQGTSEEPGTALLCVLTVCLESTGGDTWQSRGVAGMLPVKLAQQMGAQRDGERGPPSSGEGVSGANRNALAQLDGIGPPWIGEGGCVVG